jgi:hypothetical protein
MKLQSYAKRGAKSFSIVANTTDATVNLLASPVTTLTVIEANNLARALTAVGDFVNAHLEKPHDVVSFGFGMAIELMRDHGMAVARKGWNGKGEFLAFVPGDEWHLSDGEKNRTEHTLGAVATDKAPFIAMKTADNLVVPWLASQPDMLAVDWRIVEFPQ